MPAKRRSIFQNHKMGKMPSMSRVLSTCKSPAAVRLASLINPSSIQGEVADGGKVIEVKVAAAGFFYYFLSLAQFIVLHLQLDLMHP